MSDEENPTAPNDPEPSPNPPPPPSPSPGPQARQMSAGMNVNTWAMLCHLSALIGYLIPGGNFLGPLVVWLVKKDTMPEIDRHGKEALNFQISMLIFLVAGCVISFVLMLVIIGFVTIFVVVIAWVLMGLICPILAGIKANEGGWYQYPLTIRFIK